MLIAEAYWGREPELLSLGFDAAYDKTVYDLLLAERTDDLRAYLGRAPSWLGRGVHFTENHDEERAQVAFGRERARAATVLCTASVASFAAAWLWAQARGNDRPYYATEARAGEFLLGAAFAAFWVASPHAPRLAAWMRSRAGAAAGALALVLLVALWLFTDLRSEHLFRGGTALDAALTCVLIAGAVAAPTFGVARLLGNVVLRTVGLRAYSLYLVHWPVFVLVDEAATDLSGVPLFALRVVISGVCAEALYRFVEQPVLARRAWPGRALYLGSGLLAVAALTIAPFAPTSAINRLLDPEALALQEQLLANLPQITDADPTRAEGSDTLPARVLVVGDSQAWFVGTGMVQMWGEANGVHIEYSAGVGCGTTELTTIDYLGEHFEGGRPGCFEWADNLPRVLARFRPQVVVVAGGLANISDHEIDGRTQHIGEPEYDEWLLQQMRDFAERMGATGAHVLWLTNPDVDVPNPPGVNAFAEEDPERMTRYNELIEELAAELDTVDTADVAALVKARPGGQFDPTFRPDGAHMLLTEAPDLVDFLAAAIVKATAHVA